MVERDHVPFGSLLPGRNYSSNSYRFGFNGQEKDDEVFGATGTSMTAEFWQYDTRTGRRWNMDPVVDPSESPYATNNNNPIFYSDPSGACPTGDCGQYKTPDDHRVSIDKGASVFGNDKGELTGFTTPGENPTSYTWNTEAGWYLNSAGEKYSEGSYADGFAATFDPSQSRSDQLTEWWKSAPLENTAQMLGDFASEVTSKQFWSNTAEYWTSSAYQMGRWDGLSATGMVEGAPIMVFTAGFGAMAAPEISAASSMALTGGRAFLSVSNDLLTESYAGFLSRNLLNGKFSVTLWDDASQLSFTRYDLLGRAHGGIGTPHSLSYGLNLGARNGQFFASWNALSKGRLPSRMGLMDLGRLHYDLTFRPGLRMPATGAPTLKITLH